MIGQLAPADRDGSHHWHQHQLHRWLIRLLRNLFEIVVECLLGVVEFPGHCRRCRNDGEKEIIIIFGQPRIGRVD